MTVLLEADKVEAIWLLEGLQPETESPRAGYDDEDEEYGEFEPDDGEDDFDDDLDDDFEDDEDFDDDDDDSDDDFDDDDL